MSEIKFEGDTIWIALALTKLAVRCEMLEQENAALRREKRPAAKPRLVRQKKVSDAN